VGAPLSATVSAALVVGVALGFALILFGEMRRPRVAGVRDAERTADARVMAVARPRVFVAERDRRSVDVSLPENLDPFAEHYRRIYLHLTTREEPLTSITITGDDPEVAAVIALNVAAFDVREARSAIVIDTDPVAAGVSRALEVLTEPGLSDVLSGTSSWTDAIQYVPIGRDQVLAVMPSGRRSGQPSPDRAERIRSDLQRLSSRHDLIVFTSAFDQARRHATTVLLSPDVIVCATVGRTRISTLRTVVESLREAGMTIHGLVLWDADAPRLPRERISGKRPGRPEPAPVPV
jgi:Mrp family chromosome partitioning ATPase